MKILPIIIFAIFSFTLSAQVTDTLAQRTVKIKTLDGTIISGELLSQDANTMTVKAHYGQSTIKKSNIAELEYIQEPQDLRGNSYSGSHYLFNQSAFSLGKGRTYYENTYLALNAFTFGVPDNFSVTAGMEFVSLFASRFPGIFVTPKVSIPFEGGAFALSTTFFTYPSESFNVGIMQATFTLGDLDNNFSVGAGYGYSFEDGFQDDVIPVFISGITRVSDRVSILSENVIVTGDGFTEGVLSAGVRVHGKKSNNFLTVSLMRPTEDTGSLIAWPFFSGTVAIR